MAAADSTTKVILDGDLTIRRSEEILSKIESSMPDNGLLEIDCDEAPAIDIWFLQAIVASNKTAQNLNGKVTLSSRLRQALGDTLDRAGFPETFPE